MARVASPFLDALVGSFLCKRRMRSAQSVSIQFSFIIFLASHVSRPYSSAAPGTLSILPLLYHTYFVGVQLMDIHASCLCCRRREMPSQTFRHTQNPQASFNAFIQRQMIANWKRFAKVLMRIQRLRRIWAFIGHHLNNLRIKSGRPSKSQLKALRRR